MKVGHCHFKAPYPDAARAQIVREAEARAVRKIVETQFSVPERERWIIIGDFNEPATSSVTSNSSLDPLLDGFAIDLLDRLEPGTDWTYEMAVTHLHSRPDRILVSPQLAKDFPSVHPQIIRSGMETAQEADNEDQISNPHASDHALVFADLSGL